MVVVSADLIILETAKRGSGTKCQRLLTLSKVRGGSALERRQRRVDHESLTQLDDALSRIGHQYSEGIAILDATEHIVAEAASEDKTKVSAAADTLPN